jgi:hypothetical protein
VRHNLSLHPFFARVARPPQCTGKGSFWHLATGGPDEVPKKASHIATTLPRDLHTVLNRAPNFNNANQVLSSGGDSELSQYPNQSVLVQARPENYFRHPMPASHVGTESYVSLPYNQTSLECNLVSHLPSSAASLCGTASFPIQQPAAFVENGEYPLHTRVSLQPSFPSFFSSSLVFPALSAEKTWQPIQRLHATTQEHQQHHDLPFTLSSPLTPPLPFPSEPLLLPDSESNIPTVFLDNMQLDYRITNPKYHYLNNIDSDNILSESDNLICSTLSEQNSQQLYENHCPNQPQLRLQQPKPEEDEYTEWIASSASPLLDVAK